MFYNKTYICSFILTILVYSRYTVYPRVAEWSRWLTHHGLNECIALIRRSLVRVPLRVIDISAHPAKGKNGYLLVTVGGKVRDVGCACPYPRGRTLIDRSHQVAGIRGTFEGLWTTLLLLFYCIFDIFQYFSSNAFLTRLFLNVK